MADDIQNPGSALGEAIGPFTKICGLLAKHKINFAWSEKDREMAKMALVHKVN